MASVEQGRKYQYMSKVQELTEQILRQLPGGDCRGYGGCGFESCILCAQAIAEEKKAAMCPACGQNQVDAIARILGVETQPAKDAIAFVACSGHAAGKERLHGLGSCLEAVKSGFLRGECKSGCVGAGDCVQVCRFGAMENRDGVIVIREENCTGCGACAHPDVCPQAVIKMVPREATNFIPCSSGEEDDDRTRELCGSGCIACGDCARVCPEQAIEIINNHAEIDYEKCVGCMACTVKCKKKIIQDRIHDLSDLKEKVAFVRCSGKKARNVYREAGITSCSGAVKRSLDEIRGLCADGCCGVGDCAEVCRYGAISVESGAAVVDTEKCVGCKDCTYACPKHLIQMIPYHGTKMVACASSSACADREKICENACVGCGDCRDNCPNGAIYMEEAHAVIDPERCENCQVCVGLCAAGVIRELAVPEYNYLQRAALGAEKGEW